MTQRALYLKLTKDTLEEEQLLAEQKWIEETLKKLRCQRNCLQIERLQLESLKTKLLKGCDEKSENVIKKTEKDLSDGTVTSVLNLMQNTLPKSKELAQLPGNCVTDEEILCNEQELDLMISESVFGNGSDKLQYDTEEDEEESDDDEDIMLDLDMLMDEKLQACGSFDNEE